MDQRQKTRLGLNLAPGSKVYQDAMAREASFRSKHSGYYILPFDEKHLLVDSQYTRNWKALYGEPYASLFVRRQLSVDDLKVMCDATHRCPATRFYGDMRPKLIKAMRCSCSVDDCSGIGLESKLEVEKFKLMVPQRSFQSSRTHHGNARLEKKREEFEREFRINRSKNLDSDDSKSDDLQKYIELPEKKPSKRKQMMVHKWLHGGEW